MAVPTSNGETLVLVTGGSGFLAQHTILQLLQEGYKVRATLRDLSKESKVRTTLADHGANTDNLSFVQADLLHDEGWTTAAQGATYILHLASPFPASVPDNEDDLIIPAREGTLRVLRAGLANNVARVVLTSSFAAVGYGHPHQDQPFDETSWTNLAGPGVTAYIKSKTLAERAAWDLMQTVPDQGNTPTMQLVSICASGIYGPLLDAHYPASIKLIKTMLAGETPGCIQIQNGVVDARDLAALHVLALTHAEAPGQRFIAASPPAMTMQAMALVLKDRVPQISARVPTRVVPNFLIRTMAKVNKEAATVAPALGYRRDMTNQKAKDVLGWVPRSREDAIVATAESLVKYGVVQI